MVHVLEFLGLCRKIKITYLESNGVKLLHPLFSFLSFLLMFIILLLSNSCTNGTLSCSLYFDQFDLLFFPFDFAINILLLKSIVKF